MNYEEEFMELAKSRSYTPELVISAIGLDKTTLQAMHPDTPIDHLSWVRRTIDTHGQERVNDLIADIPSTHIRSALSVLSNLKIGKSEQALNIAKKNNAYNLASYIRTSLDGYPTSVVDRAIKIVIEHKLNPAQLDEVCEFLKNTEESHFQKAKELTKKPEDLPKVAYAIAIIGKEKTQELLEHNIPANHLPQLTSVSLNKHSNILSALQLNVQPEKVVELKDILKNELGPILQAQNFNSPHIAEISKVIHKHGVAKVRQLLKKVAPKDHLAVLNASYETTPKSALTAYNLLNSHALSAASVTPVSRSVQLAGVKATQLALEIASPWDAPTVALSVKGNNDTNKVRSAVGICNRLKLDFRDLPVVLKGLDKLPENELNQYLKRLPREQRTHALIALFSEPNMTKLREHIKNKFAKFKLNYKPTKSTEFECRIRIDPFANIKDTGHTLVIYPSEDDRTKLTNEAGKWGNRAPGAIAFAKFKIVDNVLTVTEINSELFSTSGPKLSNQSKRKFSLWTDMVMVGLKKYAHSKRIKEIIVPTTDHQLRTELPLHPKKAFDMYSQAPYTAGFALHNQPLTVNDVTSSFAWKWTVKK